MRADLVLLVALGSLGCQGRPQHVIRIEGMAFVPAELTVRVGDQVVWQNADMVPHTATASPQFDSGPIAPDGVFRVTLAQLGEIRYACSFHPAMVGRIVVGDGTAAALPR